MILAAVIAVAAAGIFLAITLHRHVKQKAAERAAALRAAADRLGWSLREKIEFTAVPDLRRFELFRQGSKPTLRNLMTSPAGDVRAVVFDFSYTISNGKSTSTITQTVFYATADALHLPTFSLRPEHFFHRVAGAFGYQDINFERRPEFSRLFLLRGEDEAAIRAAFHDDVLEFFERHPGHCAAGTGRELLFWRPAKRLQPHEYEAFIAEGYDVASRFAGLARERHPLPR